MEIKDIIYTIGLSGTLIISIIALIINLRNRRNGMREHLYKEQMAYFVALSRAIHFLLEKYYEILQKNELSDEDDAQVESLLDAIDTLTETYEFITPNEISIRLDKLFAAAHKVHISAIKGQITKEEILPFQTIFFDLSEDMREYLGIEKLSSENRRLSFGRLKLTETG